MTQGDGWEPEITPAEQRAMARIRNQGGLCRRCGARVLPGGGKIPVLCGNCMMATRCTIEASAERNRQRGDDAA